MSELNWEKAAAALSDDLRATAASSGDGDSRQPSPARFTLLYESHDKRFCLFQDSDGHLTAVRASRLA